MYEAKKEFRKQALEQRKKILKSSKEEQSKGIVQNIIDSEEYKNSDIIFAYAALEDEVNIDELINRALADKKMVFLPRVKKDTMQFYQIKSLMDLEVGNFKVREPKDYCCKFDDDLYKNINMNCITNSNDSNAEITKNIVVYTPGVAFTLKGERMGYGKGYYDKFFAKYPHMLKIGIAFKEQIYETTYSNELDVTLEKVVTA